MVQLYKMHEVPSLNGKTKGKTFAPIRSFSHGLAYDEASEPEEKEDELGDFLNQLAELTSDERRMLFDRLRALRSKAGKDKAEDEEEPQDLEHLKLGITRPDGSDAHKPFPGKRGTQAAMDSAAAEKSFAERFPEVMAVRPDPTPAVTLRMKHKAPSGAEQVSFSNRYPDAMKIKVQR